ncbi:hypothetical protein AB0J82_36825 [Asanoa sp. NPDC049518]|uniref:hypothetical protein n=1 Tax=unclassified Asanoa TaxID=2685164 RepID=UPI00341A8D38
MWLRQAANRAGLREASLVDAPVAAVDLLTNSGQPRARVGDYLLVVDLGAGCDATMLRRTPGGSETISALDDRDIGGGAVDDLLLTHLRVTRTALPSSLPSLSAETATESCAADDRAGLANVRAALQALSSTPARGSATERRARVTERAIVVYH